MTEQIPDVGAPRALKAPRVAEAKLRNGLGVIVVRKPTVPRVEMRLLIPAGGAGTLAAERVLVKALTAGTNSRTSFDIAQELQRLGATFGAGAGADHFQISGSVLSARLREFLELVTDILTDASYPVSEIALERTRAAQEVEIARSQPQTVAAEALRRRLFGKHRYGSVLPEPDAVLKVGRPALRRLHDTELGPRGGVMVVVGDVQPAAATEVIEDTLGQWRTKTQSHAVPPPPATKSGPVQIVDRPGSVQTNIRLAGPVPSVLSDESYAVDIANTIFGGYFISRFTENLRERRGYTYTPYSHLVHQQRSDHIEIAADVGAEVTAPALVETHYELGRMCALEVEPHELESAKRYRAGIQALRIQSQAGLAGTLAALSVYGLDIGYLREYPKRIGALTAADIREAAIKYLAPSGLVTVLVGDASRIARDVEAFDEVNVIGSSVSSRS